MASDRIYTDLQLASAIAGSRSWRGTLRTLGLAGTSAAAIRSVRVRADELGMDYQHFSTPRGYTDDRLRAAVATSASWTDLTRELQLDGPSALTIAQGHCVRLGVDVTHLQASIEEPCSAAEPDLANLARAGSLLAASWFSLCGGDVSWPLEPCRYDLLVARNGAIRRVQVKTTRTRVGGTWKVYLSTARQKRVTYGADEIDDFFIVDGALRYYLIPVDAVGGLHALQLSAYDEFRVASQPALGD
jgi:hypothetical protein